MKTEELLKPRYNEEELNGWNLSEEKIWIIENNKRMEGICKFLNESNL